jgi:hypothetical protein
VVGLDLDRHPGEPDGVAAFAAACSVNGGWPVTLAVRTPGGGLHVYFHSPDWPVASGPGPWPGTDVRAPGLRTGGYLVGPGSVVGGRAYAIEADLPVAESFRPGVVGVRLVCPPEVMDVALASLADRYGDAWQPSTRKPSRHDGGDVLQYGTLIVPVPKG